MTKTDVLSVFGGSVWTVENAMKTLMWTVNTFMRFQETENGGFGKRIGVDGALYCSPLVVKTASYLQLFKCENQIGLDRIAD